MVEQHGSDRVKCEVVVHLRAQDDRADFEPLVEFFEPLADVRIQQRDYVIKALEPIIIEFTVWLGNVLAKTAVGWTVKRWVLDPLGDKVEEWWQSVSYQWKHSGTHRPFNIMVKFDAAGSIFEIDTGLTSDPETLKWIWPHVGQAYELYRDALADGIQLTQIRFFPDASDSMVVIGYVGNRPTYTIDLTHKRMKRIPSDILSEEADPVHRYSILLRSIDYHKDLSRLGYEEPQDTLRQLRHELAALKQKLKY